VNDTWVATIFMNEGGVWNVTQIIVVDADGNSSGYYGTKLLELMRK
jgi:hypothetical protein